MYICIYTYSWLYTNISMSECMYICVHTCVSPTRSSGLKSVTEGSPEASRDPEVWRPLPHRERASSLLTTYWSGSTDVFGVPASRHGSLNPLFQLALYLPS